ncbi:MAG: SPFH domain-containing protein [Candidatus Thorarchaeota archaeon]
MQFDISFLMLGLVLTIGSFILCYIASGIKIVKEWDRVAVLRLGKFCGIRGPGIIWTPPMLDKIAMTVSLKIQQTKIDTGKYKTSDGSMNRLTGYLSWRVIDIEKVVLAVENYQHSVFNMIQQTVQKVGETFPGDTVMMDEELLYAEIQNELEPTLTSWGIKITEIKLKSASEWN